MARCVRAWLQARLELARKTKRALEETAQLDASGSATSDFLADHSTAIKDVMKRLLELTIVPRSIARDFDVIVPMGAPSGSFRRTSSQRVSERKQDNKKLRKRRTLRRLPSLTRPLSRLLFFCFPPTCSLCMRAHAHMVKVVKLAHPSAHIVDASSFRKSGAAVSATCKFEFEATNETELDLGENVEVTVLEQHDTSNNPEWWLVRRFDGKQGERNCWLQWCNFFWSVCHANFA